MLNKIDERIISIIREIEAEYKEAQDDDLFLFLFSYFFPKIDTESDFAKDEEGRYLCRCYFKPTEKTSARENLDALVEYFGADDDPSLFWAYLDISSATIPNDCEDEEFGSHTIWYGEDSDYCYIPVRTSIALKDRQALAKIREEKNTQYELVGEITDLYKKITCKHDGRLIYCGTDYNENGKLCKKQHCIDCCEILMTEIPDAESPEKP